MLNFLSKLHFLNKIYLVHLRRSIFCFFFCAVTLKGYSQKIAKTLAPQYQWEYSYSAALPSTPFDSLSPRTPFQNWALGYAWEKPFPDKSNKKFYLSPILPQINFNRVQGFEASLIANFNINPHTFLEATLNYGFYDRVFRPTVALRKDFNPQHTLTLQAGNELRQFNQSPAIVPRANSINNLFFLNNYAKLYASRFFGLSHYYSEKKQFNFKLKNNLSLVENSAAYNSPSTYLFHPNRPLEKEMNTISPSGISYGGFNSISQIEHELVVQFGGENTSNTYFSHLGIAIKSSVPLNNPELLHINDSATNIRKIYNPYTHWSLQHKQLIVFGDLGQFKSFVQLGGFIKNSALPFTDLKHFNGNETSVMRGTYLEVFGLLPYYKFSTNGNYLQGHLEHNFKGGGMAKNTPFKNTGFSYYSVLQDTLYSREKPLPRIRYWPWEYWSWKDKNTAGRLVQIITQTRGKYCY